MKKEIQVFHDKQGHAYVTLTEYQQTRELVLKLSDFLAQMKYWDIRNNGNSSVVFVDLIKEIKSLPEL